MSLFRRSERKGISIGQSSEIDRKMDKDTHDLYYLLHEIGYELGYQFKEDKVASAILVEKDGLSYDLVDVLSLVYKRICREW